RRPRSTTSRRPRRSCANARRPSGARRCARARPPRTVPTIMPPFPGRGAARSPTGPSVAAEGTARGIERVVFERIVKTFGATAALRGVSGTIRRGELTMIEGANGSGKTTLLRILGTIVRPTGGRLRYEPFGQNLDR